MNFTLPFFENKVNHFICATTEIEAQRQLGIVAVISLAPTSLFGREFSFTTYMTDEIWRKKYCLADKENKSRLKVCALGVYAYLQFTIPRLIRSPLRSPLLIKLGVVSFVTAFGGFIQWYIKATHGGHHGTGLTGYGEWPPIYMVSFPLICAVIFVEQAVIEEWKSWIGIKSP